MVLQFASESDGQWSLSYEGLETLPHAIALVNCRALSSYGKETKSSGNVKVLKDVDLDLNGRHVIVVEDLIDSGHTLRWMTDYLRRNKCASVSLVCLLNKPSRRQADVDIK